MSPSARNISLDVYRGFVMLLMMAEVLHLSRVAPGFIGYHQSHVDWAGCSLHDLIQPSFSFLVGVALPYSIASRMAKGAAVPKLFAHAIWRAFLLVALGIFLRSTRGPQTNFTFEDTLTQIGLGYPFLFLLGFRSARWQWGALGAILTGYWLAWALYPLPATYDYQAVGVPADWPHHYNGLAAHWNKNNNLGLAFDQWFMNLFPRALPFVANRGGYLTLSFIPTLGTMILGLIAGRWLREDAPLRRYCLTAAACLAFGLLLHFTGLNPIVKRIWTPPWTLFSGGACFLLLVLFRWVIDIRGYRRWTFPLLVIGMNSIAAYLIAHLFEGFAFSSLRIHLGEHLSAFHGAAVLAFYWIILYWMYQRKIFLRI